MPDISVARWRFSFLAGWVCLLLSMTASAEMPADDHVKVELVSEQAAIVPRQSLRVGVRFELEEGWHTYWINPGDSGEPPRIDWVLPEGFKAGSIAWPYPARLATPPLVDYGYEREVLLPVEIQTPSGLKPGMSEKIVANLHYLVCREVCIAGKKQLVLELPVADHPKASASVPLFAATRRQLPHTIPPGWKLSATSGGDEFELQLQIGKSEAATQFFPAEPEQVENAAPQKVNPIPGGMALHLKKSNQLLKPISRIRGVLVLAGVPYQVDIPVLPSSGQLPGRSKQD